ncbi:unnamed protein product [Cercospora beticola]|nr:unnamed protein product [Cercospora beticola]
MISIKAAALALLTLFGFAENSSNEKSGDKVRSECLKYDDKDHTKCRTWRLFDIEHLTVEDAVLVMRECQRGCHSLGESCVLDRPDGSVKGDWMPYFACTPDNVAALPFGDYRVPLGPGPDFARMEL